MESPLTHPGISLVDSEDFGFFEISGTDATDYLHRQLSNEIRNLKPGAGVPVCYLNAQGRIRLFFHLWKTESGYFAQIVGTQRDQFIEEMERLVFREDIEFVDKSDELSSIILFGNSSENQLPILLEIESPAELLSFVDQDSNGIPLRILRLDWLQVQVFQLVFPRSQRESIENRIQHYGLEKDGWEEFHTLRVEKGTPWPDYEINDSMIPYECGLGESVSLTKGCYVGQEVIARMANLGTPPRLLRGLVFDESKSPAPERGSRVISGDVEVGEVFSSGFSDRLKNTIASTSIRKKFAAEGTLVSVGGQTATVRMFPLRGSKEC